MDGKSKNKMEIESVIPAVNHGNGDTTRHLFSVLGTSGSDTNPRSYAKRKKDRPRLIIVVERRKEWSKER